MAARIAFAILCAAGALAAADAPAAAKAEYRRVPAAERTWERYREIAARNIFSQQRRPFSRGAERAAAEESEGPGGGGRGETKSPDRPERWVLLGVSKVGDRLLAFFEDTDATVVRHAARGETVGICTLAAITLDNVTVRVADREQTIAVGCTLAGDAAPARAPAAASEGRAPAGSADARPEPAEGAAETPPGDGDSVLDRLLRRRQQEMGGPGS
ncbi:MAG TPA: hypothetical protein DCM87_12500 [Planctomycetes bacterium]|nr:hypothetical protein [Planctomycetota bacterium]